MNEKIEQRRFACPMLRQLARLKLTYSVSEADVPHHSVQRVLAEMDCQDKLRCGIARMDAQGQISFNWDLCPARISLRGQETAGDLAAPPSDIIAA
jgi:hypothetical protein